MDKKAMMDQFACEAYAKGVFTGTWLYAENGDIVSSGAVGFRDPEDTLPMREDSIFELASVSKQFTAAAIMLLYKRGLLRFEDELSKFFPENPYEGVTISHLLYHTSGLPDHEDWAMENLKDETSIPKNDLCVRFLRESGLEPAFAPGEKWEYSNTAYCLLAEIVAKVSGMPFETFMQKEIFEPCGMLSTRVCHIRVDGIPFDNFARGLVFCDGKYRIPDELEDCREVILLDGECGVGFVYTNIFDMLRWDRALREETLFTKEDQAVMFTPALLNNGEVATDGEGDGYGFGWFITDDPALGRILSHSGGWPGYATWCERCVEKDRMLVILCCREPEDIRGFDCFFEGMSKIARDKEPEPIKTIEDIAVKDPDKSKWEGFCGKYEHPEDADFIIDEVIMKDGELYANAIDDDGDDLTFRLYPIGGNEFGRKGGMLRVTFGDNCLVIDDVTCRKL
ncbi:MAG: beta-lactamase family protein [Clostridia bacterium]|nr:beta-lactamase family protein [Clostridia bacterium]